MYEIYNRCPYGLSINVFISYATLIEKIAILQKNNPVFFDIFSTLQILLQNLQLNVA